MSVNIYDKDNDKLKLVAGGTLYADAPIGSIQAYGGIIAPSGWLLCQGQAVSRTTYANLFNVIGISFGRGNGSTTFNVPDLRETVPVGSDARDNDVIDHDIYTIGEFKDDQLQDHVHNVYKNYEGGATGGAGGTTTLGGLVVSSEVKNARTGTTTHGKQLGVNYIIKAKQVAVPTDFSKSLIGYLGGETNYNLYPWSNTRAASTDPVTYLDFIVEQDGWYSVDYKLTQSGDDMNIFAIRDFDEQGETHGIGRAEIAGCTHYRNNIIVPLKAGTYRYLHSGKGTLNVYMNLRDFA